MTTTKRDIIEIIIIYLLAFGTIFVGCRLINGWLNESASALQPNAVKTSSTLLTVPDSTGYNSATDVLQTSAGMFVYQRANYGTEFLQGGENNMTWVLQ